MNLLRSLLLPLLLGLLALAPGSATAAENTRAIEFHLNIWNKDPRGDTKESQVVYYTPKLTIVQGQNSTNLFDPTKQTQTQLLPPLKQYQVAPANFLRILTARSFSYSLDSTSTGPGKKPKIHPNMVSLSKATKEQVGPWQAYKMTASGKLQQGPAEHDYTYTVWLTKDLPALSPCELQRLKLITEEHTWAAELYEFLRKEGLFTVKSNLQVASQGHAFENGMEVTKVIEDSRIPEGLGEIPKDYQADTSYQKVIDSYTKDMQKIDEANKRK